ncbi:hypothetical protein Tco_1581704, partial [Tanacetum coccineum]
QAAVAAEIYSASNEDKAIVACVGNKKRIGHFQVVIVLARSLVFD